jgi:hypothetical protein
MKANKIIKSATIQDQIDFRKFNVSTLSSPPFHFSPKDTSFITAIFFIVMSSQNPQKQPPAA